MASVVEQQNPQVVESNGPAPAGGGPPAEPPNRRWWQRRWGAVMIGLAGLLVGAGLGASGGTKTKTITHQAAAQTVTQTVQGPARTRTVVHVRKVPGPTKTVTAAAPSAPAPSSSGSSGSSGALSWSGNGIKNIGTINVPVDSIIKWTNDGEDFTIYDDENTVEVSSQASSGQSDLAAGTYHGFEVAAIGNWTIDIVPK